MESFDSSVIRSQSFTEPTSLGCELHRRFSVCFVFVFPLSGGTGWLQSAGVRYFPSLQVS